MAFFELIGRPDEARSARVQDPVLRSQSANDLYGIIAEVAPSRSTDEWIAALRERDIPCARVNGIGDLLHDPHLVATGFFREYDHPTEGRLRDARSPFRLHEAGGEANDRPVPALGADGEELLASLGFTGDEIERLAAAGVVRLAAVDRPQARPETP
jgi:crotonobetainyl-CoA:carnitine CoA-transferase CaiB-like acyl-CoA transferase